jgi:AP-3 complex subunit delta-1
MDAALRKAKDSLGQLFDKNMQDLVRGIRNHKENEVCCFTTNIFLKDLILKKIKIQSKYIADCIDEIKQELKQDNIAVKTNAISKLCYVSTETGSVWVVCHLCFYS